MPRVREFDPQTVLADATQIFWRNGFADTSMEVIISQTGVSRYGILWHVWQRERALDRGNPPLRRNDEAAPDDEFAGS